MFKDYEYVDMKILPNRRWKGSKNEAIAPSQFKLEQSSDRRVYNFMKINAENLKKMGEHAKQQKIQSGIDKTDKNSEPNNKN